MPGESESALTEEFFADSTLDLAKKLLGCLLYRRLESGIILCAPIVEVEAYTADDPACHAFRGKTKRCEAMFGPPGHSYVYFIYGMHHCFNVVTEKEGTAGAVLIRALGIEGADGPAKLCRTWQIDRRHNGMNLLNRNSEIWLADGKLLSPKEIGKSKRIGISAAQERLWRFFIKGHPQVSGRNLPK